MRAAGVEVSGEHEAPNKEFGPGSAYRLVGDTKFGWRTEMISGEVDLNGHALTVETGGGNRTVLQGVVSGRGSVQWIGGKVPQVAPSILGGRLPNRYAGPFVLVRGVLDLDKPEGVLAITGDLTVGAKGPAVIRLANSEQIEDTAHVSFEGPGVCGVDLQGHTERVGSLGVRTHVVVEMGGAGARLRVGDSSGRAWDLSKTVTIRGFRPESDEVSFGGGVRGLTQGQVARIGFEDPGGMAAGLYTARFGAGGRLEPFERVVAKQAPFDLGPDAVRARAGLYQTGGRERLVGLGSPLRRGMTVAFFGDSITWQNGYVGALDKALKGGEWTRDLGVRLINRGINGGGVLSVRDGTPKAAWPGDSAQAGFADCLARDRPDIAVVFIGINDVWWRKTAPEVFEGALRDLVDAAVKNGTEPVLATLSVRGELPTGANPDDARIEEFADITRRVAAAMNVTLVDLRRAYLAYLQNHNVRLRVDGTLQHEALGILTYDGVHPNGAGVELLADLVADGLFRAASRVGDR